MSIKCGYASIDERGRVSGGRAGDQTGKEVKIAPWYNFGQDVVLRFENSDKAQEAADCMTWLCKTNYIGYDQSQRTTAYSALKKLKWQYKKLRTKTETDCSQLIATVLNCIGIKVNPNIWTGNMQAALVKTGEFIVLRDAKYLTSDKYLKIGDIILNTQKHVIMALEDGSMARKKIKKPTTKYTGNAVKLPKKGYLVLGDENSYVSNLQSFLKWYGVYKMKVDGSFGEGTKSAVELFQYNEGLNVDGMFGPASYKKALKYI